MSEWFSWVQFAVATAAGLLCLIMAFANRKPGDVTVGSLALVEVLLIVQLVAVLVAPAVGNPIRGDGLELWMYLIAALLLPPLAGLWAIIERVRWSNAVLAVAAFAVGVMVIRMQTIWVG
ncbi:MULTISPECIES: hypothetical protein [Gulosibacter]|uniref:hypothetical protein n=1 Tax=Gulosibacter TaxID=256818 RepID=UPI000F62FE16|nr:MULTISPECIES: hypothetical protein [Gulosibacter]